MRKGVCGVINVLCSRVVPAVRIMSIYTEKRERIRNLVTVPSFCVKSLPNLEKQQVRIIAQCVESVKILFMRQVHLPVLVLGELDQYSLPGPPLVDAALTLVANLYQHCTESELESAPPSEQVRWSRLRLQG